MIGFSFTPTNLAMRGGGDSSLAALSPLGWYDPSDLSTIFRDVAATLPVTADGDAVALVLDKSGNGRHFTQSDSDARPVYRTSGGKHWLEGDGIDDVLTMTDRFGLAASPALGIGVGLRVASHGGADRRLLHVGGETGASMTLAASVGTDGISWRHDGGVAKFGSIGTGSDHVVYWHRGDGATIGSQAADVDGTGRTLVSSGNGAGQPADTTARSALFGKGKGALNFHGRVYGVVVLGSDDAGQQATVETYLAQKCGVTL